MTTLKTLEAKVNKTLFNKLFTTKFVYHQMADIEESLSLSLASRRRKGTSLGSVSSRSSPKLDTIFSINNNPMNIRDHDRENMMQK